MGLDYLINISYVDNVEVFKTCLDYWNYFVPDVYARYEADRESFVLEKIFPSIRVSPGACRVPTLGPGLKEFAACLGKRRQTDAAARTVCLSRPLHQFAFFYPN